MLVTFDYLKEQGIQDNRVQLGRAIKFYGFPPPLETAPNSLRWDLDEVQAWVKSRPRRIPKVWDPPMRHLTRISTR